MTEKARMADVNWPQTVGVTTIKVVGIRDKGDAVVYRDVDHEDFEKVRLALSMLPDVVKITCTTTIEEVWERYADPDTPCRTTKEEPTKETLGALMQGRRGTGRR